MPSAPGAARALAARCPKSAAESSKLEPLQSREAPPKTRAMLTPRSGLDRAAPAARRIPSPRPRRRAPPLPAGARRRAPAAVAGGAGARRPGARGCQKLTGRAAAGAAAADIVPAAGGAAAAGTAGTAAASDSVAAEAALDEGAAMAAAEGPKGGAAAAQAAGGAAPAAARRRGRLPLQRMGGRAPRNLRRRCRRPPTARCPGNRAGRGRGPAGGRRCFCGPCGAVGCRRRRATPGWAAAGPAAALAPGEG